MPSELARKLTKAIKTIDKLAQDLNAVKKAIEEFSKKEEEVKSG